MPRYAYKARKQDGALTQGTLRAANEDRANSLLRANGLTPVSISESEGASFWSKPLSGSGVGMKDRILFTRQVSSMIRAGVPILEALKAVQSQTKNTTFRTVIQEMSYDVEGGESLSNTMARHPQQFDPFILGVVRTGEASGRLSESLSSIADYLEQDYVFLRKVRAALVYPIFVLVLVVALSIIMFTFVLPQLVVLFEDANITLPVTTRVLISITQFVQQYWVLLLGILVAAGFLVRSYLATPEGKYLLSTYLLRTPGISGFFQKLYLARLTSILHTLFSSDVPVLESLTLARDAVGNRVYQRILEDTVDAVRDGASISFVWRHEPYIPAMLTSMVAVGERSGELEKSFIEASTFFKRDVNDVLDAFAVLLEPVLILILGAGVGIVVSAVLLPIYNLVLVI